MVDSHLNHPLLSDKRHLIPQCKHPVRKGNIALAWTVAIVLSTALWTKTGTVDEQLALINIRTASP